MSCENLSIPKPQTGQCPTTLFGIPYGDAGRVVAGTPFTIDGIVLHCYDGTVAELCNEMKCRTRSSVISGSYENSFHYGIGAAGGSGGFLQFIEDGNVAWSFGTYKNNTYATVPPPNIAINWPVLQGEHGINTTPDVYTLNIALAIGEITAASALSGCYTCPTASGLQQTQHDMLVQMLAYLVQEYNIPIDQDHIQFHDLIHCGEGQECPCTDITTLLVEVAAYCPPCEEEALSLPIAESNDVIEYLYGVTEPCCPSSPGCLNLVPWNECFIGGLAVDGTLDSYILGLSQDPQTMQWCLTRGCLALENPLIGCGTTDDPLRIDSCFDGLSDPVPPEDITKMVGLNGDGCFVNTPIDEIMALYETPLVVVDTQSVDLTVSGTADHTLQADVLISADGGNQIEIRADGLFADFTCVDVIDAYPQGVIDILIGTDIGGDCVYQNSQEMVEELICNIAEDGAAIPTWVLGKTDQECPVFVTPASIVAAGLVADDTTNIDLTLVSNVLTAEAIIDPAIDNILVDNGNGLYVPDLTVTDGFCVHMNYNPVTRNINSELLASQLPDNIFQCLPGVPPDSGAYVQDLTVTDTNCIDLTYVGRNLTADIKVSAISDNVLTCEQDGLYVQVGAGLAVVDTDCLNLTLVGGLLSGVITLAPTQGIIPNAVQCIAGQGLYVAQGAGLTVTDTSCIDLNIVNGNLTATIVVNPSGDNQLECGVSGLYVPIGAGLLANDTDCVNHNLVGGVLTTTLNIAGPQGGVPNILSCIAGQGLYVPESHINVIDSTCIDLTFTGGVLRADIIIDPTGDNQVQCLPAGLYVPPTAGLVALDTDCIALNLASEQLTATPILAPTQAGCVNALQCLPGGLYVPQLVGVATDCINVTVDGCDIIAVPIISPDDCNSLECRANGLYLNNEVGSVDIDASTVETSQNILPGGLGTDFATGTIVGGPPSLSITNPSTCNEMQVFRVFDSPSFTFTNTGAIDALIQVVGEWSNDGGMTWFGVTKLNVRVFVPVGETQQAQTSNFSSAFTQLPGQTNQIDFRFVAYNITGDFSGLIEVSAMTITAGGVIIATG